MTDLGLAHHILIHPKKCAFWGGFLHLGEKKVGVGLVEWGRIATFVFHIQTLLKLKQLCSAKLSLPLCRASTPPW